MDPLGPKGHRQNPIHVEALIVYVCNKSICVNAHLLYMCKCTMKELSHTVLADIKNLN